MKNNLTMKRALIIQFMLLIVMGSVYGKKLDEVRYRVTYNTIYYNAGIRKDVSALDIGDTVSVFYSMLTERMAEITDSINRRGSVNISDFLDATKGMEGGQVYRIYKSMPERDMLTFVDVVAGDAYRYEEKLPAYDWQLVGQDTVICGYHCQRAVTDFRGRRWAVWFAADIPVHDGPWKLCGLPGLILKAEEAEGFFSFECVGLEKMTGAFIEKVEYKCVNCTPVQYQKLYYSKHRDPIGYMKKRGGADLADAIIKAYGPDAAKELRVELIEYYGK